MLKTIGSTGSAANSKKIKGKAGGNSMVGDNVVGGSKITSQISLTKGKNQVKTTIFKILVKSKNCDFPPNSKNIEAGSGFFILKTGARFTQLKQVLVEASILYYFDPKC